MKIKSLLVAGLAVLAMNAFAEDYTCTSTLALPEGYTIAAGETDASFQNITLTRVDEAADFTNIEFQIAFPGGLKLATFAASTATRVYNPETDEYDQLISWAGDYIANGNYRAIGANLTKTAITTNPIALCRVKFAADETFNGGSIMIENLKYTDYADNSYTNEGFELINIEGKSAVANVTAGKAVAGVKYYNVAGQASDKAFDGVNVVVTTFADGTQEVVKVVK